MVISYRITVAAILFSCATALAGNNKTLIMGIDGVRADALITGHTPYFDQLINGQFGGGTYNGAYAYYAQTIQESTLHSTQTHTAIMSGVKYTTHAGDWATYPHFMKTMETADPSLNTAYLVYWSGDLNFPSGADYIKQGNDMDCMNRAVGIVNGTYSDGSGYGGTSWGAGADPDVLFVFLGETDEAGHLWGFRPDSPKYLNEISQVSWQTGQIMAAIENRPNFATENWQVIVVSDHGGLVSHGPHDPHNETIPLIVSSKSVQQGQLANSPIQYDTAATAIAHVLGAAAVPAYYDGQPRGDQVQPTAANIGDGLVAYLQFNGDYNDSSGRGNDASVGANSDHDPTLHGSGGKFGGYVEINDQGGGSDHSSYLTLGKPGDLDFSTDTSYTVVAWFRPHSYKAGAMVVGNKDAAGDANPGTDMSTYAGDQLGTRVSDTSGTYRKVMSVPYGGGANQWWFLATTYDRNGNVTYHVGTPDGTFWALTDFLSDLGNVDSPLPWNLGQDGTGNNLNNLDGDLDDIAFWNRTLSLAELETLYNDGAGIELYYAIPEPATLSLLCLGAVPLIRRRRK